jgi:hypothetical protein
MYTKAQEYLLNDLQRQTGNTFVRIGPPQQSDLVRVCAKEALTKLQSVHEDMLDVFEDTAREYLADQGTQSVVRERRVAAMCTGACHSFLHGKGEGDIDREWGGRAKNGRE